MSEEEQEAEDEGAERPTHLEEVPDGAGCVEIWDRLSAGREGADE